MRHLTYLLLIMLLVIGSCTKEKKLPLSLLEAGNGKFLMAFSLLQMKRLKTPELKNCLN
jgi:hypothetical protein